MHVALGGFAAYTIWHRYGPVPGVLVILAIVGLNLAFRRQRFGRGRNRRRWWR